MKTLSLSLLTSVLLLACGGSNEAAKPVEPAPASEPIPAPEPMPAPEPAPAPEAEAAPAPAPEPAAPAPMRATAELKGIPGDAVVGTMSFEQQGNQIVISGSFTGLKKGDKALYIHEKGDCGNKGKNAGGHFNPTSAKHGPPASAERHAGDFGNLTIDDTGTGNFSMSTDSITIEPEGASSVVGRAVVIHAKKDDKKGSGGPAIACGVIAAAP
jgi:Cu-Zn family superoxide dismutase